LLLIVGAVGLLHFFSAAYNTVHGIDAIRSWTVVQGRVVSSKVITILASRGGVRGGWTRVVVRYPWQSGSSDCKLRIETYTSSLNAAWRAQEEYAEGSLHEVFINPRHPDEGAVHLGYNIETFGVTVTSLPLALVLIPGAILGWKNREALLSVRPPRGILFSTVAVFLTFAISVGVLLERI
jgi:hypothetical protein